MPTKTAGREAVERCPQCDRAIYLAACLEGWCNCCSHSRAMPPYATLWCLGHRLEVNYDWHCSDWESDKLGGAVYFYCISQGAYSDYDEVWLRSDAKFTEPQLDDIVRTAMRTLKHTIDDGYSWRDTDEVAKEIVKTDSRFHQVSATATTHMGSYYDLALEFIGETDD